MKKIYIILAFIIIINCSVSAQEIHNPLNLHEEEYDRMTSLTYNNSCEMLRKLGITTNLPPYAEKKTISRRNAFELIYIAYMGRREIYNENDNNYYPNVEIGTLGVGYFADVGYGTYDYYLTTALRGNLMINGRLVVDSTKSDAYGYYADLDSDLTYNEALTLIVRRLRENYEIFEYYKKFEPQYENSSETTIFELHENEKNPDYIIAKKFGLINTDTITYSPIYIPKEKLEEPIPVKEFEHLLYCSLFIPIIQLGDYVPTDAINGEKRFIDYYISGHFNPSNDIETEGYVFIPRG